MQARAKERIERVLNAAEAVFVDVGYERATTNMIAARAETSVGSIYEFFGNKEALASALVTRYVGELRALSDDILADDPGGRDVIVVKVVDALDAFYARHPGIGPLLAAYAAQDADGSSRPDMSSRPSMPKTSIAPPASWLSDASVTISSLIPPDGGSSRQERRPMEAPGMAQA